MKIAKKTKSSNEISTSSMPDIIFMLLIFFMVTTTMREFIGLPVIMPRAKEIEKLESKRNTVYVWASKDGLVSVDDQPINVGDLHTVIYKKLMKNPKITISLKSDVDAQMKVISEVHEQMREAQALKLSYSALRKGE